MPQAGGGWNFRDLSWPAGADRCGVCAYFFSGANSCTFFWLSLFREARSGTGHARTRLIPQQNAVRRRKRRNADILCNCCPIRGKSRKSQASPYIVSKRRVSAASERRPQWRPMFLTGPRRSTSFQCEVERPLAVLASKLNRPSMIRELNPRPSEVAGTTKLQSKKRGGRRENTEARRSAIRPNER